MKNQVRALLAYKIHILQQETLLDKYKTHSVAKYTFYHKIKIFEFGDHYYQVPNNLGMSLANRGVWTIS